MLRNLKLDVVLLSGGSGTRFGSDIPKTFIKVKGRTLILYPLLAFASMSFVRNIVLVVGDYPIDCISNEDVMSRVKIVKGGKTRFDSVYNGLQYLNNLDNNSDFVAIHDAARPFVPENVIKNMYHICQKESAVAPGIPVTDTIKSVDENNFVVSHLQRSNLRAIQTPQMFKFDLIYNAYLNCTDKSKITDDTQLISQKIFLAEGSRDLFKLTYPEDLLLCERMADKYDFLFNKETN